MPSYIDGNRPPLPSPAEFLKKFHNLVYLLGLTPAFAAISMKLLQAVPSLESAAQQLQTTLDRSRIDEGVSLSFFVFLGFYWSLYLMRIAYRKFLNMEHIKLEQNDPSLAKQHNKDELNRLFVEATQCLTTLLSVALYTVTF